jgi:hypothetical protein
MKWDKENFLLHWYPSRNEEVIIALGRIKYRSLIYCGEGYY